MTVTSNIFAGVSPAAGEETLTSLLEATHVRIERIVSLGHASPPGFWYDEEQHEWVIVLQGAARLLFEGDAKSIELRAGDHVNIPARTKHRVEWTTPEEPTVWLAVHFR